MQANPALPLALIFLLCQPVAADVSIGLVAYFPDGFHYTGCLDVPADEDLKDILERTGLAPTWSYPPGLMGVDLCGLHDIGCPRTVCECAAGGWRISYAEENDTAWRPLPVAVDVKGVCWERGDSTHNQRYCPREGDVIGLAFGAENATPTYLPFRQVCPDDGLAPPKKSFAVYVGPEVPRVNETVTFTVRERETLAPVEGARIVIRSHPRGHQNPSPLVRTDGRGVASYSPKTSAPHEFRIYRSGFDPYRAAFLVGEDAPAQARDTRPTPAPTTSVPTTSTSIEASPATGLNEDYAYPAVTGAAVRTRQARATPPTTPRQDVDSFASFLLRFVVLSFLFIVTVLLARRRRPATYPDYQETVIDTSP